jgi:hypothetical protein
MSETADERSKPRVKFSPLRVLVGVLLGVVVLIALIPPPTVPRPHAYRVVCLTHLKALYSGLSLYSQDHGGRYPPPGTWCDCLLGAYVPEECFRCRGGEGGRCDYAMNPMADPCSPPDTVLLFECSSGWNRFGGSEILTTKHHEDKGACVLFVEGTVRFVKAEEIPALRWDGRGGGSKPDLSPAPGKARRPATREVLEFWLKSMVWHHRFTTDEIRAATGLDEKAILAVQKESSIWPDTRPTLGKDAPLLVLPYPGGRHPRIGFLEGAVDPQRETKFSVFTPWDPNSYVVVDVPEAIWSNLGLTYLAHTHIDTIWTKQGIELPKLEWKRRPDGRLDIERTLPNGIAFGVKAVPTKEAVRMEMWLRNGTEQKLTDLRVQICVMPKMAAGFAGQTNENKVFTNPYVACRSADGRRWIITAWENCDRPWGNEQCPCFHSDPKFPDLEPGHQSRLHGWLSFYEGPDIEAEFARIEALGWWRDGKAAP